MIIDCHCHAGKAENMTAPWNSQAALAPYLRRARAAGIDKTVVFALFDTNYARANAEVARIVAANPERLIGFVMVHTKRDRSRIWEMVGKAVAEWGFRGIKVHGSEGMVTREVCEAARKFRIPILIDVVGRPWVMDMCAPQYPDVNFIVPHLGSFVGDFRAHQQVVDLIQRHKNVYTDTSSVRHFDYIVQAVKRGGPHKVLFGTDGPWLHPGVELEKVRLLGLSAEAEALVTGGNVARLIRLSAPGSRQQKLPMWKVRPRSVAKGLTEGIVCGNQVNLPVFSTQKIGSNPKFVT